MKRLYKLLLIIFLLPAISFAQSNFKPGYVITAKGDTVKGFVDYREWDSNPTSINFKPANNKIQKFTPADISYFSIDNLDAFEKYTGPISRDETNDNRIINGRDTSFFTGDVFLKVLQKGAVINLYSYADAIKPRLFFSDPTDNIIHELVYRVYYDNNIVGAYKGRTVNENTYIQQLTAIAIKAHLLDDKLQSLIEDAGYTAPAVLKITTKMNGLSTQKMKNESAESGNFDFYAGLAVNSSQMYPHSNYQKAGGTSHTSVFPQAVFGFNAYVNPNTRQLVFSVELSATQNHYQSIYDNKVYPYERVHYKFTQTLISLTPQVSYNFYNGANFKVYAGIGISLSKYMYGNEAYVDDNGKDVRLGLYPFYFLTSGSPMIFKIGTLINNRFQVYASYSSSYYYSLDNFFGLETNSYQVGVNYFFGKRK
jgi:hypothetical protein